MDSMKTLSVVVPVYYNEESLPALFAELQAVEQTLRANNIQLEMIFVDDGSGDNSLAVLLDLRRQHPRVKVAKHARNFGSMQAIKTGFRLVTGDAFTILAADLQDPPELIPQMVERWLDGAKFIICARAERDDPPMSKFFSASYYKLLRAMVVPNYPPGGYDMALMDKIFLPYLQNSGKNINIPLFAYSLGFRPQIIRYKRQAREHGQSRWTFSKKFKFFLDSLLGFSIAPIRIISMIGLAVSGVSFVYGLFIVINALLGNPDITGTRGFATLAALISFLLGMIIVMLGVIGEYIWRIFDEINHRPESVVEEIF